MEVTGAASGDRPGGPRGLRPLTARSRISATEAAILLVLAGFAGLQLGNDGPLPSYWSYTALLALAALAGTAKAGGG